VRKTLNKFNFILGIISVMIFYFPGLLIGEIVTVALKVILKIFNTLISFIENLFPFPSPYVRGTFDVVFEAFTMTLLGRAVGIYIMIFIPILIFKKFTKLNINWLPSIFLLIPTLLYLGGVRQIERYIEIYDGVYLASISLGFILGTFMPLYYAYTYTSNKPNIF
jgi:hypothetical protein